MLTSRVRSECEKVSSEITNIITTQMLHPFNPITDLPIFDDHIAVTQLPSSIDNTYTQLPETSLSLPLAPVIHDTSK